MAGRKGQPGGLAWVTSCVPLESGGGVNYGSPWTSWGQMKRVRHEGAMVERGLKIRQRCFLIWRKLDKTIVKIGVLQE